MIKERLSGLRVPLIYSGTDYIPEPEVIHQIKQDCRKWTNLASFYLSSLSMYLYCRFHVIINFEERKLLVANPFGDILDLPGKINVYLWWNIIQYRLAFHTSAFISKFSAKTFLQTSFYCLPGQKYLATALVKVIRISYFFGPPQNFLKGFMFGSCAANSVVIKQDTQVNTAKYTKYRWQERR